MIRADPVKQISMIQSPSGSRLISRVLPMAVKLWLHTQLDAIGALDFEIQATDRQVLSGTIPRIVLSAQQAVYQGVRITDVALQASGIQINIGQVLRGSPLRLQQAFPVEGQVAFDQESLRVSCKESVLTQGLMDFWRTLLTKKEIATEVATYYGPDIAALQDPKLAEYQSRIEIVGSDLGLYLVRQEQSELILRGSVDVKQGNILRLITAQWCLPSGVQIQSQALGNFGWHLGEHTNLRSLTIQNNQITCQCRIMVQP
ncbi:MAG: DUF2993 domain-containing protein [Symploca sp. SIO2G7]|nr:DUF2993 domain-containing protein [Symploca sp. SIO2G7]